MQVIKARNAHLALPDMVELIFKKGDERKSRDGEVISIAGPTAIEYQNPMERVVFWKQRDANPFFHLIESLWMLSGRRDLAFLEQFVKTLKRFSDDQVNFHAAYGFRWREHFNFDQLSVIIHEFRKNKDCRRQYLAMWDPESDLGEEGKDFPCNVGVSFHINKDCKLDMTVFNRSNDFWLGALGANCVHMSILQEYIATGVGVEIGTYWQVSANMHGYQRDMKKAEKLKDYASDPYRTTSHCLYDKEIVEITPVIDLPVEQWDIELKLWMKDPYKVGLNSKFFKRVATPMWAAYKAHKEKDDKRALEIIGTQMPENCDWKLAAKEWIERRCTSSQ